MSFLDLDQHSERDLRERAALNPLDLSQSDAGVFDGVLKAPFKGAAKGLIAEPARALNLGLSALPRALDVVRGDTEASDWWFEKMVGERSGVGRAARELAPDPYTTGIAGQILHSFFDIGGQAITFGPTGVATLKAVSKASELVDKGVDAGTALKAGAAEGALLGVAVHLPMSIGLKSLGNAFWGAGASVIPSAASRGAVHTILAENGYPDMAAQYQWLDLQQIAIDAILGIALGGLGTLMETRAAKAELRASDLDAALAAHNARHLEVETAPGLPKTPAAREAHVAAVSKALDDLIEGRPVDVSESRVHAEGFIENPQRSAADAQKAKLLKPYEEVAAGAREIEAANDAAAGTKPAPEPQAKPEAEPKPKERGGEPKATEEAPEVAQASQALAANPDMVIRLVDGTSMKAAEAMAAMDEHVATVTREATMFDAAVRCFLRG